MAARSQLSGLRKNKKTVVGFIVVVAIAVYLLYSWISSGQMPVRPKLTFDAVEIPKDVLEKAKEIKIKERVASFEFSGKAMKIFVREYKPQETDFTFVSQYTVLLLHGVKFSSNIWADLGTIQLLGALSCRVVAIDLPGHGKSAESSITEELKETFLSEFLKHENLSRPVFISPSMSGRYSMPYIMNPKPSTCMERARAFIPIAPAYTDVFTQAQYHQCELPVLITFGEKDKGLGLLSTNNLRNMPNSRVVPISGAGHAYYTERPEEWHRVLYNFMLTLIHGTT